MPHLRKRSWNPSRHLGLGNKSGGSQIVETSKWILFTQMENGRNYFIVKIETNSRNSI
jgi:hypothetical protein